MLRPRILTGLVVAVFAGVFASQVASCTLDQEGTTEVETGKPCTVDSNCDDANPCTTDTCPADKLVCEHAKQMDNDAPAAAQTPADCRKIVCNSGVPSTVDDALDFINDNNSCTADACTNGAPTNTFLPEDSICTQGTKSGTCKAGTCKVSCMNNNDCDDGNACTGDLCDTSDSTCVYDSLDGVLTPGVTQTTGDCKVRFCENGIDKEINDDADVYVDGNSCTDDVCAMGIASNPAVAERTLCAMGNDDVCDGQGKCVDCVVAADCVSITETECEKRSCVNNTCQIAYEGTGTLASPVLQTPGDCMKVVCNGNMGTTSLPDDADLPNDGFPCTTDTCSNGTPVFTDKAQGTSCGTNQVCNSMGDCVGCNAPTDCQGTDTFCQVRTCNNNVCGVSNTPNNTNLPMADQIAGDCKVRQCNGTGGIKTTVQQSDVPVDGNQCTQDLCSAQGNPSNPATSANSPCSVGMNDACDGAGTCKKSLGKTCGGGTECVSTRCVDGVCCDSACTTLCRACNVAGNLGTCTDVPKGQDDGTCTGANQSCNGANDCDDENGQGCGSNDACLSNFCVDGVCCESACNTACKSCNVSGGTPGVCANLPAMSQDNAPTNLCVGMNQCDGNGVCKKIVGASCTGNSDCLNNQCVDGVCCSTTCTGTCKSCNVMGLAGTCSNVLAGEDPDNDCTDQMASSCGNNGSCDGAGACQKYPAGTQCAAQSCTGSTQTNASTCAMNMCMSMGTTPCAPYNCDATACKTSCTVDGDCTSGNYCDAPDCVAKKSNGQMCMGGNQCSSGNCVDGVCCNNACTTVCQACNIGGSVGTCSDLPHDTDDTFPPNNCTGNYTCDGSGSGPMECELKDGQPCTMNGDCASNRCMGNVCVP